MKLSEIGPGIAGGNNRQALTEADSEARRLFKHWCETEGMEVKVDKIGNMFARRQGKDKNAAPVLIGSHLDTQPTGGKFDGPLGVLAGLEIVRTLNDAEVETDHPIEIVNWTNEEGCRFAPPMMASGVFAGVYDLDWAYSREDSRGHKFGDELKRIEWMGDHSIGKPEMKAYFELHIEQGPILEDAGVEIGVVTHGQGLVWTRISLLGKATHTGPTPMDKRVNAGLGMARIINTVEDITRAHAPNAVGAVGHCEIQPNSVNVVPGMAVLTVDFRSPDQGKLDSMIKELYSRSNRIASDLGLSISFEEVGKMEPVTFDSMCVSSVRKAAKELGYSFQDVVSGAGHDAFWLAKVVPSAMVMCPCVDGLSHNEAEEISQSWAESSANVLLHAAVSAAQKH